MSLVATPTRSAALVVAEQLRNELERLGVVADVHEGDGVALLSVWLHLVVWCERGPEGWRYRWWTGRVSQRSGRWIYTGCRALAVKTAAQRIAARYAELRRDPSSSSLPW
ncbi:hypothetical protein [Microbispora bryophytorum]|uniref:hypothetical protein n=1 Tax=Microbispora bryophytorum TaxID=1460882 RepID=UPI003406562C